MNSIKRMMNMTDERESEIYRFFIKSVKAEDKRPYFEKIFDTFIHNLKVLKERLSPIR